eukprot:2616658-Alexandrium_andersonii.AAC.1
MSASLVGSEMCIRDSPDAGRDAHFEVLRTVPPTRILVSAPMISTMRAVSYTHLTLPTICSV